MQIRARWLLALATLVCFCGAVVAQGQTAAVPNLVGLNIPQATAALNRVGLSLGNQTSVAWTQAAAVPQNTISVQAVSAGQAAPAGSAVDVTVLRSPNVSLNYDDNQLTLINNTGAPLDFNGLIFGTADGTTPAAFAATRWAANLSAGGCAQIWSISRSSSQNIAGCAHITTWKTTNNPAEHFWAAANGLTQFKVVQNGVERGNCPAAGTSPLTCDLYLPANANEDATPYIYFAYTTDSLIIFNRSADAFMPLTNTTITNNNPNLTPLHQSFIPGDPSRYTVVNAVASASQLAPNQCLLFTNDVVPESLDTPQPCDVIARARIAASIVFWTNPFDIKSATDGKTHTCNAAAVGQLTICVMPR